MFGRFHNAKCGAYLEGENAGRNDPVSHKPKEPDILVKDWQDMVSMPTEIPVCVGWNFKGWRNVETDEDRINEDRFVMPTKNMRFRATWGRPTVSKSTTGQVYEDVDDYLAAGAGTSSSKFLKYTGVNRESVVGMVTISADDSMGWPASCGVGTDVSDKQNGSVMACSMGGISIQSMNIYSNYGYGNGYIVYIQTKNTRDIKNLNGDISYQRKYGVHANPDSSYMFYKCLSLNGSYVNLGAIDTSDVTDMSYMFSNFSTTDAWRTGHSFPSFKNFDTSKVRNMSYMFANSQTHKNAKQAFTIDLTNCDLSSLEYADRMFFFSTYDNGNFTPYPIIKYIYFPSDPEKQPKNLISMEMYLGNHTWTNTWPTVTNVPAGATNNYK